MGLTVRLWNTILRMERLCNLQSFFYMLGNRESLVQLWMELHFHLLQWLGLLSVDGEVIHSVELRSTMRTYPWLLSRAILTTKNRLFQEFNEKLGNMIPWRHEPYLSADSAEKEDKNEFLNPVKFGKALDARYALQIFSWKSKWGPLLCSLEIKVPHSCILMERGTLWGTWVQT